MKKKYIVVTGGAGFVGSNLIAELLNFKNFKIISLDNYSSGSSKNHILHNNVNYINGETKNITKILNKHKSKISCLFHFGEFPRIYQSFLKFEQWIVRGCRRTTAQMHKGTVQVNCKFCCLVEQIVVHRIITARAASGG